MNNSSSKLRLRSFSLRTKLLVSVMSITVLAVSILAGVSYYNASRDLTTSTGNSLNSLAQSQAVAISNVLVEEANVLESFGLSKLVQDRVDEVNAAYDSNDAANLQQIQQIDQQWQAANAANNNNAAVVRPILNNDVASELREFQETFPENSEVFVTDRYGALVAATNRTSDYYQADEDWWQAAYNDGKGAFYFGQPEFDESSQTFGIILAVPLLEHGTNKVNGVIRTTLNATELIDILSTPLLDGTAHTDLYLPGNQTLAPEESATSLRDADPQALAHLAALTSNTPYDTFTLDGVLSVVSATSVTTPHTKSEDAIKNLGWTLIVDQSQADNQAPLRQETRSILFIALTIFGLSAAAAYVLSQSLSRPIINLTEAAQKISSGDIAVQAKAESNDEIGTLANAFNIMTAQLRTSIVTLEQHVAERTKALASVAEISTAASTILETNKLMQEVVDLTKERFGFYHAHIYLLNEQGDTLILAAGAGEPGRQMVAEKRSIPLIREQSLVARAARERKGVTVNDVTTEPDYLPNPLLPNTHSELAVPLIIGEEIIGVLDVQSEIIGRFTDADISVQTTLASQVASAVQNARSFERAEESIRQLDAQRYALDQHSIVAITDVTGKIIYVNDKFTEISKYPREELLGQDHRILNSGYHSKEFMRNLWVTIANGKVFHAEIKNKAKDGSYYWVDTTIVPFLNERGKPIQYLAIRTDITNRKNDEEALAKRTTELEAVTSINQKIQNTTTIEAALQIAARELGHVFGKKPAAVMLSLDQDDSGHDNNGRNGGNGNNGNS